MDLYDNFPFLKNPNEIREKIFREAEILKELKKLGALDLANELFEIQFQLLALSDPKKQKEIQSLLQRPDSNAAKTTKPKGRPRGSKNKPKPSDDPS